MEQQQGVPAFGPMLAQWRPDRRGGGFAPVRGRGGGLSDEDLELFLAYLTDAGTKGMRLTGRKARRNLRKFIADRSLDELVGLMAHLFFMAAFFPPTQDSEEITLSLKRLPWVTWWILFMLGLHLGHPPGGSGTAMDWWDATLDVGDFTDTYYPLLTEVQKKKFKKMIQDRVDSLERQKQATLKRMSGPAGRGLPKDVAMRFIKRATEQQERLKALQATLK